MSDNGKLTKSPEQMEQTQGKDEKDKFPSSAEEHTRLNVLKSTYKMHGKGVQNKKAFDVPFPYRPVAKRPSGHLPNSHGIPPEMQHACPVPRPFIAPCESCLFSSAIDMVCSSRFVIHHQGTWAHLARGVLVQYLPPPPPPLSSVTGQIFLPSSCSDSDDSVS